MVNYSFPIRPQLKGRSVVLPTRIGFCFWCGKDLSFDRRRISFCCNDHSDLYYKKFVFNNSVSGNILDRDHFTCVKCGFNERNFTEELNEKFPARHWDWRDNSQWQKRVKYIESKGFSNNQNYLEIDHIIPVRMGGDPLDPDNQQTLCYPCHKKKTKKDVGNISKINAICREIRANIQLKKQQKKMENYWNSYYEGTRRKN